jgi:dUTP pyrophosphatase
VAFQVVDELDDTARGAGGHGSTGGHHALPTQQTQS